MGQIHDAPGEGERDGGGPIDVANVDAPVDVRAMDVRSDTAMPRDTVLVIDNGPGTDTGVDRVMPPPDTSSCTPATEVCNGRDDDCDGMVDEGLGSTTCGSGPCMRTQENCVGGVSQTCMAGTGAAETCNGVDDDCDGMIDDGLGSQRFCGGRCVDTATDAANCGSCGNACASGSTCTGGTCGTTMTTPNMLRLVNQARATARMCGTTSYPAVPALTWDARLEAAALEHSVDMATNNYFSHTGLDGSTAGQRVTRQGYTWSTVGENIAAGQPDEASVMDAWLMSPGHCANIMAAGFTQMGAALARGGSYGIYWTQNFARPR